MYKVFCLTVIGVAGLGIIAHADTPSRGDGFLYLGDSGYAYLSDAEMMDVDYLRDFSVEVVVRIEAHQAGGRWAAFIKKGGDLLLRQPSSAGFAIGTREGNSQSFAKFVAAKISDGQNYLSIESPQSYQGYVYAVLTWEVGSKTMTLFINGELVAGKSNAMISSSLIKNAEELRIGRGDYELRRNVFLARLWNRALSASQVANLWAAFSESKRHTLPQAFDRTSLVSEWLMDETCEVVSRPGTVRLRDSAGANPLRLVPNARLIQAEGLLAPVYPPDRADDVDKSVILRASGGRQSLGESCTRPLQYYFEIDESPTFNSPARRWSGWTAHYAQWKPVLKPNASYWWRVKVRDSGVPPEESAFSDVQRFTTRGPSTWYVRPLVDRDKAVDDLVNQVADQGVYGRQDGTSYEDAFNGIPNIKWGEGGVEAGDTLYVCDTHVYTATNDYVEPPVVGYIKESGYSSEYPITIRMDCPSHQGRLCGFALDNRRQVSWIGPDGNDVYYTSDLRDGAAVESYDQDYRWLDRETRATWPDHPGAVCNLDREDAPGAVGVVCVKMSDKGSPDGRVYAPDMGFQCDLGRSSYVRFSRCSFFNSVVARDANTVTRSEELPSHHIVFEDCDLGYKSGTLLNLSEGMSGWIVRNCDLHDAADGVTTSSPGQAYNLLVERCRIYNIGAPNFPNDDAHAIGIQNGANHIIQHNHIWNVAGSAIEFWSSKETMKNMTVRYNFIHDTTGLANTSASGIVISGDSDATAGKRTGFKIYNNIVMNTAGSDAEWWRGWGISSNSMDSTEIYNNVLYHTYHGLRLVTTSPDPGFPVKARVYNNMIVGPRGEYAHVEGVSGPWKELYWDHNLYYPATDVRTRFLFTQNVARDARSVLADPRFVAAVPNEPDDFQVQADSQAIDAGVDVNVAEDFSGVEIPQGEAPDIGAFEYER
jgi:hypothetical protein